MTWPPEDTSPNEIAAREERVITSRRDQLLGLWTTARSSPQDWYVSNYWLPQSMALARAWLQGAARQQVEQACELAARQVPLPHCVVFLDRSPDHRFRGRRGRSAGRSGSRRDAATSAVMRELAHQASHRGQGPVVHVPGGDLRLALTELTAAIDAMR